MDQALPRIAERVYESGGRLLIAAADDALCAKLDTALWTWKADSFIPHGRQGDQPVLISNMAGIDGYDHLALADGVWRDEALGCQRAFYFFDEATIQGARDAWRALTDNEAVERHYWKQGETGGWTEGP